MPQYQITSPSGQKYRVTAPEGATQEEVLARVQAQESAAPAPEKPAITKTDARSMLKAGLAGGMATPEAKVIRKDAAIQQLARDEVARKDRESPDGTLSSRAEDFFRSTKASAANTFGIGPKIQARISAAKDGVSYDDALTYWRANNEAERNLSDIGNFTGMVIGGGGVAGLGKAAVGRMAAAAPGAIQTTGNVLQNLFQMQRGRTAANLGRASLGGATFGGLQAAGEGKDAEGIVTDTAIGAVAAPVVYGGLNLGGKIVRHYVRPLDILPGAAGRAAREVITDSPAQIRARQEALSRSTGANVPVIAALSDQDFSRVTQRVLRESEAANGIAARESAGRVNTFMDRMIGHVNRAGNVGRARVPVANDLAEARREMGDAMMRPIENNTMDLVRIPMNQLQRDVTTRLAAGTTNIAGRVDSALNTPTGPVRLTVRELDDLRQRLSASADSTAGANPDQSAAYEGAARAIREFVEARYPEYGRMIDVWAANSRMLEGFQHAAAGRRIADVTDTQLARNLRTNEGRIGMRAGELHRQRSAVSASPAAAIRNARNYAARGDLTAPAPAAVGGRAAGTVTENIGEAGAARLADASGAEDTILTRMLDAGNVNIASTTDEALNAIDTALYGVAAATGGVGPAVKAHLLRKLIGIMPTTVPEGVSRNLAEMLFSADPARTRQALNALDRLGLTEQFTRMLPEIVGLASGRDRSTPNEAQVPAVPMAEPTEQDAQLQQLYEAQPGLDDLAARVEQVESAGRQDAVSPKGAVGVMQVMPTTAPEAAALAGVEFDENLYRTDEAYNRLLGTAYLAKMLEQFDGNQAHALAAYNAGPTAVRKALVRGRNWLSGLPAETQDYVKKILG